MSNQSKSVKSGNPRKSVIQTKDSGIEWLGKVPSHWRIGKLKRFSGEVDSGVWGQYPNGINETIVLRSNEINLDGSWSIENPAIRSLSNSEKASRKLKEGDLVLVKSSGSKLHIGKTAIVTKEVAKLNCCFSNFTNRIRTNKKILNGKYLWYIINYGSGREQLFYNGTTTTGLINLNTDDIASILIPLPPLPEQKAIADYLDRATEKIDRVIAIKQKQLELIENVRKSRIDECVCFGLKNQNPVQNLELAYLPKIKAGWSVDRFKDVANLRTNKTDEKSDEFDYLELEDIEQGTGVILNKRNTLEVESKVTLFKSGDVLFGKLRPYLEKYHFAQFDGKCTGEILAFEPTRIEGRFLTYILGSSWFINLCNSMSYGAKMPRVNWNTQLAKVILPIPSKNEQLEIVKHLDQISSKTHELIDKVKIQITTLQSYRQSLIHECVTGKKRVVEGVEKEIMEQA